MNTVVLPGDNPAPAAVLQALASQTHELLLATDPQGRITWANRAFLNATGWDKAVGAVLLPHLYANLGPPAVPMQPVLELALVTGELADTAVLLCPPGLDAVPLKLQVSIVRADALRLWRMVPVDAVPHELATPNDDTATRLALAVELADVAIWRHDFASNRLYYNRHGFEVLGRAYCPEGLSLEEVRSMIHPEDLPAVLAGAQTALRSNEPTDVQARYRHIDGSWRHVLTRRVVQRDAVGEPIAFLGVGLDLTDQIAEQGRAAEEAHRLHTAMDSAGIGVWSWDTQAEQAHWNRQMYHLCGRDARLGPPSASAWVNEIIHPDDRERMLQAFAQQVADTGDQVTEHEYRVRRPDGELRWLVDLIRFEQWKGRPIVFGATLDVTERRQAEAVQRDAIAARRLAEARSQLLARVSHELRTPLNAILGFTQLLEIDAGSSAARADPQAQQRLTRLGHIHQASESLLTLVNEVLDLSSIEAGLFQPKLEPVALDDVVAEVLTKLGAGLKARGVQLSAHSGALWVEADRARLAQVLAKLVAHRLPLIPAGGALQLRAVAEGEEIRIDLSDNGHALTPAQQLQLFDPFGRVGTGVGHEPDTGLNLALVKALVACMGGRIDLADSTLGGIRFTITLSRAVKHAEATPALPTTQVPTTPTPTVGKVLYIEDNPINVILVEELIAQRGGLELVCEVTGALGVARARDLQPDLILIDMQLPDFDGFEVLRQLRVDPATAGTRCIALSANAMSDDVAQALAAGFDDYWTKPIRFGRFLDGLDGIFPRTGTA